MSEEEMLKVVKVDENKDMLTGEHGAQPVGVAAGAAAGAVAGAVLGTIGGAVGLVAGTAAGAIAGAIVGKAVGEAVNPTVEDEYWRVAYLSRPYYSKDLPYEHYQPAYRHGWETYLQHAGRKFDEVESDLERTWQTNEAVARLEWKKARLATRDAWERLTKA